MIGAIKTVTLFTHARFSDAVNAFCGTYFIKLSFGVRAKTTWREIPLCNSPFYFNLPISRNATKLNGSMIKIIIIVYSMSNSLLFEDLITFIVKPSPSPSVSSFLTNIELARDNIAFSWTWLDKSLPTCFWSFITAPPSVLAVWK